jgi:two-component system nitrogen regulation response regulator NtrX
MARAILIIDDEESIRTSLKGALEDEGYEVITAEDGMRGIEKASDELPDLILLDIWMPGIDGIETLNRLKRLYPKIPVVMMSGHGTIEAAVKATKLGAYDFIEKPLSLEKVTLAIGHALEVSRLEQENLILKGEERHTIIGESEAMKRLKEEIRLAALSSSWVLITGENGAGKEVVAWNIHDMSLRKEKPFVAVSCAAIPEELMESELFGYEKGAFTGAVSQKKGKFDMAHEGTLFLDEIGGMPLTTQAKILRILQEQRFERVGGAKGIKVDVRVIAATTDPSSLIPHPSSFTPIHVPPLRERVDDIPLFVEHFINEFSRKSGKPAKEVSPQAVALLKRYNWPGNVRELRNLIERLVIMTPSQIIEPQDLPPYLRGPEVSPKGDIFSIRDFKEAKQIFEKELILRRLEENGWNVTKTAEAMGIERSHLHKKIKAYGIEVRE